MLKKIHHVGLYRTRSPRYESNACATRLIVDGREPITFQAFSQTLTYDAPIERVAGLAL